MPAARAVQQPLESAETATPHRAGTAPACAHCGLPIPADYASRRFCCSGCEAVAQLLAGAGLERFYELGGADGQAVGPVPKPSSAVRDWLPVHSSASGEGILRLRFDLQGIRCAACVWLIQELWRRADGALHMDLNPSLGRATVTWDPARLDLNTWLDSVERLGYRAGPPGKGAAEDENRGILLRLGICSALALNGMMFAFSGYLGLTPEEGLTYRLFEGLSALLALAAVLVGGPVFFRAAWSGLRRRVLHLDLPISLGILLAFGGSVANWLQGGGGKGIYFDTVTIFIALMLAGRYLQQRALQKNRNYLLQDDGAEHLAVRVRRPDGIVRVPVRDLAPGDTLLLASGELVPARCRLPHGEVAAFSLDWIEGESVPRRFTADDEIPAGAFVAEQRAVEVEVKASAAASGLLDLLRSPDGDREEMRGQGRFWLLLNRSYVAIVLGLGAVAALLWAFVDPSRIVEVTTAVLVVTCPCALGIATPLAFDLAVAALRRRGVYVRSHALLEKARHIQQVVFDKTGTLTSGDLQAAELRPVPEAHQDVLLTMVQSSNHPVSRAIAQQLETGEARFLPGLTVREEPGLGLETWHEGHRYRLGGRTFTLGDEAARPGDERSSFDQDGLCTFTRDGHVEACFQVVECYRGDAVVAIDDLRAADKNVYLCSGDEPQRCARAAQTLSIDADKVHGGMKPGDKARLIRSLDHGDTLMVGDGINDAEAFDAAFCAGTPAVDRPVMPSRADFFYTDGGVAAVTRVLRAGRRFHRVVTANLWLAGAYNLIAVSLCLIGWMTPLLCAVLMPLSSILLVLHTAGRMRDGGEREVLA